MLRPGDDEMTTETTLPDKLIDRLPKPVRHMLELIGILSALATLVGWLASTASLLSKMTFWSDAWSAILKWSINLPEIAQTVLHMLGASAHWVVEYYRWLMHPVFEWIASWLPWHLPPIAFDVLSIMIFGVFGAIRLVRLNNEHVDIDLKRPIGVASRSGLLLPVVLVQVIPLYFILIIDPIADSLGAVSRSLAKWFGQDLADIVVLATFCLPVLSAFPLMIWLTDWAYISFVR